MAYVLIKNGWEYNDEVYSRTTGGIPKKLYHDLSSAQEAADKLNLKELRDISKYFYAYLGYEVDSKTAIYLEGKGINVMDDYDVNVSSLSDKDLIELGKIANVQFYEILEMEEAND